ncbi:MAG: response regulator [Actinomycetota bacterium]
MDATEERPVRVLVVDDSRTIRQQVRHALEDSGCELLEAADGVEGLDVIESTPDLGVVICDVNMPQMDGLQMLERVRDGGHDVPVVMLTTEGQPELIRQAKEFGARGWMVKPIAPEHLRKVVDKLATAAR